MARLLLKLSGEILKGDLSSGICPKAAKRAAVAVKGLVDAGHQLGLVLGGGNLFRGASATGMKRSIADEVGMLGTVMNGVVFREALGDIGCPAHTFSGLVCPKVVESYTYHRARKVYDRGDVVIFVGGTGNPFFTTDTNAALRASEMEAEYLLKGTKVDGVYSSDPVKNPDAEKFSCISYDEVLAKQLRVMDATAFSMCRDNQIPILVFKMSLLTEEGIYDIEKLKQSGTEVR